MQSGAEQKQTRTIMGRYNDMRPIGGYSKHPAPNIEREAKKAKRSVRLMRPGQIHSDLGLRREINLRYNTLYKPRYGWEYPAYTRFMGVSASDYPQNYPLMYGYGPRSDHYYYGLTPKDVVLARNLLQFFVLIFRFQEACDRNNRIPNIRTCGDQGCIGESKVY